MNNFTWLWIGWIAAFVIIEGIALTNKKDEDTLSEHVWKWTGIGYFGRPRPVMTLGIRSRRFALLAFMAWLILHFLTGGFF